MVIRPTQPFHVSTLRHEGHICACMDARRNQVYNALFRAEKGALTALCEDRAISLAELKEELAALQEPVYLVGDGAALTYRTLASELSNLVQPPEHRLQQRGAGVALAALEKIQAGECGDAATLQPNYLRLSQAEREKLEKENKN